MKFKLTAGDALIYFAKLDLAKCTRGIGFM